MRGAILFCFVMGHYVCRLPIMPARTTIFIFLLLHEFSHSVENRKSTPEEELEEVEKIVSGMENMDFHESEDSDGIFEEEIDELMLDGLEGHKDEDIIRKAFDSETGDTTGKRHRNLDNNLAAMPHFYGETEEVTKTMFRIKLSHEQLPSNIPFYEFVVLRLNTDSEGYPRLPKEDSRTWQTFIPYTKEPIPEHPYIAARFARGDLPRKFTVGDNLVSLGLINRLLNVVNVMSFSAPKSYIKLST